MNFDDDIAELVSLIGKVRRDEALLLRLEEFYLTHQHKWRPGMSAYFKDYMERKNEILEFEKYRLVRLGQSVAAGRTQGGIDI